VIDLGAVPAANAFRRQRSPRVPRELGERAGVFAGHREAGRCFDQEEPVATPGDVADDLTVAGNGYFHVVGMTKTRHVADGHPSAIVHAHTATGVFDPMRADADPAQMR
jgi:hypothetical protein